MKVFVVTLSTSACKVVLSSFTSSDKALAFCLREVKGHRSDVFSNIMVLDYVTGYCYDIIEVGVN